MAGKKLLEETMKEEKRIHDEVERKNRADEEKERIKQIQRREESGNDVCMSNVIIVSFVDELISCLLATWFMLY